jgi:hypothetical protein
VRLTSRPALIAAISWLMQKIRMSLSWIVARPLTEGVTVTSVPLWRYSRMRRSGRVASEKTGCSIVPRSPLGAGSRKSQKKNSPCNGPPAGTPPLR